MLHAASCFKRIRLSRTVPRRGRIAKNVTDTILPIVKFLEVIPKGSIVLPFSIYHIIRNRCVD